MLPKQDSEKNEQAMMYQESSSPAGQRPLSHSTSPVRAGNGALKANNAIRLLDRYDEFPSITHCLFDLVGTLEWSEGLLKATRRAAAACVAHALKVSEATAEAHIRDREAQLMIQSSYRPALSRVVTSLHISLADWAGFQSMVKVEEYLSADEEIIELFEKLRASHKLVLYTNMPAAPTKRALLSLGLDGYFTFPICSDLLGAVKPDKVALRKLVSEGRLAPRSTLAIGDRFEIDLAPVISLGGYGFLIQGRDDLIALGARLIQENGG